VTTLAGSANHATYDANGILYSCGYGALGAGPGVKGTHPSPVRVKDLNGSQVSKVVSSYADAGALLTDGRYYDWGANQEGQLGDGNTKHSSVPVEVDVPAFSPITVVAQGGSESYNGQTLVKLADGILYAWGDNSYGQISQGDQDKEKTPVPIRAPNGVTYAILASGAGTSYAITTTGDVYAWGENDRGQVGNGTTTEQKTPVQVASMASFISSTAHDVVAGCEAT
jgi:alpha-tubulin suppressor-like RCC1 family protein